MSSKRYVLWSEPHPYIRSDKERRVWDGIKQSRFIQITDLLEQHGDRPLFKGPLSIEIYFYLKSHDKAKKSPGPHDTFHYSAPSVASLLKFFEEMATGVLITSAHQIATVKTYKRWDIQPRTEVIIEEIEP